ncbi:hypothetical protein [Nostoc sp. ChiQUE01b]|uniref:hypothetical protein n=1 Tax=Nostoc sp. ChiQUE01b TaxID=3075376 RepID=UPI002AD3BC49|nr:hypothetical protein [Nostoc sp. ChiQUE01b]MDZ8262891.1 hypothetical protein [Nostoc sp. ChiQUE01b]
MQRRTNIKDKFTTFLYISENSDGHILIVWKENPELVSNFRKMVSKLQQNGDGEQEYSEEFLVLYFLNQTKQENPNPSAFGHLAAYLQETVYDAAKEEYKKFPNSIFLLTDCLLEAQKYINDYQQLKKILNKFDPERGSLEAFVRKNVREKIQYKVFLFLRMGVEKAKYSDAGLLRNISAKYLKESLQKFGIYELQLRSLTETSLKQVLEKVNIEQPKLSQCLLAWKCFKEIADTKIKNLTSKQLKAITNRYKELASSQKLSASVSSEDLQVLLQTCDDSARQNTLFFQCDLAWRCYKQIYAPNTTDSDTEETTPKEEKTQKKLEWPSPKKLEPITNRYNQFILSSTLAINSEKLDSFLKTCVKALRADISKKISLSNVDTTYINSDGEEVDLFENVSTDKLVDPGQNEISLTPWEKEIKLEDDEQLNELKSILINSYNKLPRDEQKMLQLELGLSIDQVHIGYAFNIRQFEVSRRLQKAKRLILRDVVKLNLQKFNCITPNEITPKKVEDISTKAIDDCLEPYFKSKLEENLSNNFPPEGSDNLEIFKLHYEQKLSLSTVAERLKIHESALQEIIDGVKQQLCLKLSEQVQRDLPLNSPESDRQEILAFIDKANQLISTFVDTWIKSAPYATFGN